MPCPDKHCHSSSVCGGDSGVIPYSWTANYMSTCMGQVGAGEGMLQPGHRSGCSKTLLTKKSQHSADCSILQTQGRPILQAVQHRLQLTLSHAQAVAPTAPPHLTAVRGSLAPAAGTPNTSKTRKPAPPQTPQTHLTAVLGSLAPAAGTRASRS